MQLKNFLALLIATQALCFDKVSTWSLPTNKEIDSETTAASINQFGWDLYKTQSYEENIFLSPFSISSCLSMVYLGARNITQDQMEKTLHITQNRTELATGYYSLRQQLTQHNDKEHSHALYIANGIWVDNTTHVLTDFNHMLMENFHSRIQNVDFIHQHVKATREINNWIAQKTDRKIIDLLSKDDLDETTRLVIANAIYFKGSWIYPFEKSNTRKRTFYSENGKSYPIEMMRQTQIFSYFETTLFQAISLPFSSNEENQVSFMIFLPKKNFSLKDLEKDLTAKNFAKYLKRFLPYRVSLQLPKFALDKKINLNNALTQLGMRNPFTYAADFSGIDGLMDLYLDKVLHQAYVTLDEMGVVATASTAAIINRKTTAIPSETLYTFIADHPFIFAIVDHSTNTLLFIGKLIQPQGTS